METKLGVAWYRKEQWERLRSVSSDRDGLETAFEEWEESAKRKFNELRIAGNAVEKVDVDVEELVTWCKGRGMEIDGKARSHFVADKLRKGDA